MEVVTRHMMSGEEQVIVIVGIMLFGEMKLIRGEIGSFLVATKKGITLRDHWSKK